jgi:hypothetical protein
MSQYTFVDGNKKVLYGWDDPLRYYFLVITEIDDKGDEKDLIFSNLDLDNPAMTVDQIKKTLSKFNLSIPPDLEDVLKKDKIKNELFYEDSKLVKLFKKKKIIRID